MGCGGEAGRGGEAEDVEAVAVCGRLGVKIRVDKEEMEIGKGEGGGGLEQGGCFIYLNTTTICSCERSIHRVGI